LAGYSGTPLVAKLGIKPGLVVVVLGAPDGFSELVADRPDGVTLRNQARGRFDMAITFQTERKVLERRLPTILRGLDRNGTIWVAWPKQAAKVPTDLSDNVVREVVLPIGLVDVKVCAIDETWSGLKVVWRKERR
jgi:hypothetical protein